MKSFFALLLLTTLALHAEMLTRTKVLMNTFVSMSLDKKDKKYFKSSFEVIKDVENSLSSYKKNSPIYTLNQSKKAQLDTYSYEALMLSTEYYKKTDGYFNIAIGTITKDLYQFGVKQRVPKKQELIKSEISFSALKYTKNRAWLAHKGIKIDLGGMGKGFAIDAVVAHLYAHSIHKARVALSGDIRCLDICKIEVNTPFSSKSLCSFLTKKKNMGISTSGNYNRFVKEKKNNHLINPKTKISETIFSSITLISTLPSSDLDAFTTAAIVMPKQKAYQFLDSLDVGYIVLTSDKKVKISKNIDQYITDLVMVDTKK